MNSRIRVKSRILILDKNLFLITVLSTGFLLMLAINLLPYIMQNTLMITLKNHSDIVSNSVELVISFCIFIGSILSFCAFSLGVNRYFLKLAQSEDANIKDIFYYFSVKRIFNVSWFYIRIFTIKAVVFIFCQLPSLVLIILVLLLINNSVSALVLMVLCISIAVLIISGLVFYKLISSSLFLMKYYYISGKFVNFSHALASSQEAMLNEKHTPFALTMSFSAWFLSCVFIIPIAYVWSYYIQSKAVFANLMLGK